MCFDYSLYLLRALFSMSCLDLISRRCEVIAPFLLSSSFESTLGLCEIASTLDECCRRYHAPLQSTSLASFYLSGILIISTTKVS